MTDRQADRETYKKTVRQREIQRWRYNCRWKFPLPASLLLGNCLWKNFISLTLLYFILIPPPHLSQSLSLFVCVCVCVCLSVSLSVCICLSVCFSLPRLFCLPISVCVFPPPPLSFSLSVSLPLSLSLSTSLRYLLKSHVSNSPWRKYCPPAWTPPTPLRPRPPRDKKRKIRMQNNLIRWDLSVQMRDIRCTNWGAYDN